MKRAWCWPTSASASALGGHSFCFGRATRLAFSAAWRARSHSSRRFAMVGGMRSFRLMRAIAAARISGDATGFMDAFNKSAHFWLFFFNRNRSSARRGVLAREKCRACLSRRRKIGRRNARSSGSGRHIGTVYLPAKLLKFLKSYFCIKCRVTTRSSLNDPQA